MGGRYRNENETAPTRAGKNNCWIRYYNKWYTTEMFYRRYGEGSGLHIEKLEILNPIPYLYQGRAVIEQMIKDKKPVSTILNALDRLHKFEDMIRNEGYQPKREGQKDKVEWPDPPPKIVTLESRIKKEEKPADYNDLDNVLKEDS